MPTHLQGSVQPIWVTSMFQALVMVVGPVVAMSTCTESPGVPTSKYTEEETKSQGHVKAYYFNVTTKFSLTSKKGKVREKIF